MKKLNLFIYLFIVLTLVPFISSVPPTFYTDQPGNLQISTHNFETLKQGEKFDFYFHLSNTTQRITNTSANCTFHLYSQASHGEHIYTANAVYVDGNLKEFEASVPASNFTELGIYSYIIDCNTINQTGTFVGYFEVTQTGFTISTAGSLIRVAIIIALVCLMFFFGFVGLKLLESMYPHIGYILLGLSSILGVVSLYDAWVFTKSLSSSTLSTIHFGIFNGVMLVIIIIFVIVGIFTLIGFMKELLEKREKKKYGDGYNTKSKQYEY